MGRIQQEEHRLTVDDYASLDEPDDFRSELVRGRLVREPRPSAPHARTQTRLSRHLDAHAEERDLGVVLTDAGVILEKDPATVRGPDVLFISHQRLSGTLPEGASLPEGFLEVAPDLAVEIVSPENTATEIQEKVLEYLDAGTRMVWVVDPQSRSATVYRSRHDVEIVGEDEDLDGGEVLPGLRLPLRDALPA